MRTNVLRSFCVLAGILLAGLLSPVVRADGTSASSPDPLSPTLQAKDAAAAWEELESGNRPPPSPKEWATTVPTSKERQKFYLPYVTALADKAKDFYTRFPKDSHAIDAKLSELKFLMLTVSWGNASRQARLDDTEKALLKDSSIPSDQHFMILWTMAQDSPPEKARPLLEEITKGAAPERMKTAAADALKNMDRIGQALDIQFTAVDGRSVDLAKLKGKVVLIDFWATWCGPCVGEVPNVKKTYDQYHDKGFEIIGISLDKEKDKLTGFTAENKMAWPQFFDGQFWQNKYARQFGIESIPTMWLVDKTGKLRNMNAREDLAGGVQKLLAE